MHCLPIECHRTNPCGKKITAECTQFGDQFCTEGAQDITVEVLDKCPSCDPTHLDLSPAAWNKLTNNMAQGVVEIVWSWVS
jgi:expansin (peptidoglycan-binding protein)